MTHYYWTKIFSKNSQRSETLTQTFAKGFLIFLLAFPALGTDTFKSIIQSAEIDFMTTSSGRKIRHAHWKPKKDSQRKALVIIQGRASFIEKHSEFISDAIKRGYDVFTYDLPGQGLSTNLLNHPQKGHIDTYDTYLNDTHQYIEQIVLKKTSKPIVLFGSSMGGHIAVRYLAEYANQRILGAILESPMIDILTDPYPRWVAKAMTYMGTWLGFGDAYMIGYGDFDPKKDTFEKATNTRDKTRFLRQRQYTLDYPTHVRGGPTVRWIKETFDSIGILQNAHYLSKITVPVLLMNAGQDKSVLNNKDALVCQQIPKCKLITYKDSYHHIVVERDKIRNVFWADFDTFMKKF